jgi:hypothetical protein
MSISMAAPAFDLLEDTVPAVAPPLSRVGTSDHEPIYAVQHLRKMRGGAQSHLLRASDGLWYVTKFQENPQGVKILANEMLASSLGIRLGLPMPQTEIVDICEWLIQHTPELRLEVAGVFTAFKTGLQLGSRYVATPDTLFSPLPLIVDYLPEGFSHRLFNLLDFARAIVLDKWTANVDGRQAVFTCTFDQRKWRAHFIDQGYCFNAEEWTFPDLPLHGVYYRNWVYQHVTGWNSFEPALSLAEQMSIDELWDCAHRIPPEWYKFESSRLCQIVETLYRRRSLIRDLITAFRNTSRAPFPNWV